MRGCAVMRVNRKLVRFLWTNVIFLAFIGIAVATRRSIVRLRPGALSARNNPAAALAGAFADRRTLTLAHILPGMLFMVLGPLQFVRGLRSKYPQVHRWCGRIFLSASAVVGVTSLCGYLVFACCDHNMLWGAKRLSAINGHES